MDALTQAVANGLAKQPKRRPSLAAKPVTPRDPENPPASVDDAIRRRLAIGRDDDPKEAA